MSSLYQIDAAILDCVDEETGEIIDEEALDALMMEREQKINNVAWWVVNLDEEIEAYAKRKKYFAEREANAKKRSESLKGYLLRALDGKKCKTSDYIITFSRSESVEVDNEREIPAEYMRQKTTSEPDKLAIKAAIKAGEEVSGCRLVENRNVSVK